MSAGVLERNQEPFTLCCIDFDDKIENEAFEAERHLKRKADLGWRDRGSPAVD
jgi:hypothetical protein